MSVQVGEWEAMGWGASRALATQIFVVCGAYRSREGGEMVGTDSDYANLCVEFHW